MNYCSQLGQDRFVDEFFNKKEGLVFLDIGSHDGVTISNTYFLEKERKWKGICVEAQPSEFDKLKLNRDCICINVAVSNFEGETDFTYVEGYANMLSGISDEYNQTHMDRIKGEVNHYGGKINTVKVPVKKLQTILDEQNLVDIDFCSIDTEGSEFNIIQSIDFDRTKIKLIIVENNYKETNIKDFLEKKNYFLHSKLEWDDVFVKKDLIMEKNVVVTAADSSYFGSLLTLISGVHKHGINCVKNIYVYNLGLSTDEINHLNKLKYIKVFNFPQEVIEKHSKFLNPTSHVYKLYCLYNSDLNFDNIFWLDAGTTPINDITEIFNLIEKDEVFMVADTHLVKTYTHSKCIEIMSATEQELNNKILSSGIIGYKKNGKYEKLFEEAFNFSLIEGCVDGDQENHRHDQSVYSILCHRYHCPTQDIDKYGYWTDAGRNLQTALEKNAVIFVHRRGYDNTKDLIYEDNNLNQTNVIDTTPVTENKIISKIKFIDENLVGQEGLSRYISPNTNWNKDFESQDYDIAIYTDRFCHIKEPDSSKTNYAWIIEPPVINGENYVHIQQNHKKFKKVFSYNKSLSQQIDNFEFVPHCGTWLRNQDISLYDKTKNISFIYSDKNWNIGHRVRHNFANFLQEKNIDVNHFGSGSKTPIEFKIDGLKEYRFSIVMENSILDDYFTEKIIDCFLSGVIPVYWGTKNIVNYFDENGIIFLPDSNEWGFDFDKSIEIIKTLDENFYSDRLDSVVKNFNEAQKYKHPEHFISKIIQQ